MLVYDYVEITKEMFYHITVNSDCYKTVELESAFKEYYKAFGQTVIKIKMEDINLTQYFINSAYAV